MAQKKCTMYAKYEWQFKLIMKTIHPIVWLYKPDYKNNYLKSGFVDTPCTRFFCQSYETYLFNTGEK
jgi:hypothetical protein